MPNHPRVAKDLRPHIPQYRKAEATTAEESQMDYDPIGKVSFVSNSFTEYLKHNFLKDRFEDGVSVLRQATQSIWIRSNALKTAMQELDTKYEFTHSQDNSHEVIAISEKYDTMLEYSIASGDLEKIKISTSDSSLAKEIVEFLNTKVSPDRKVSYKWIYSPDGQSIDLTEIITDTVDQNLYPFVKDFDTFYDRFAVSRSNILILQGPPGTGKSSFIKNLVEKSGKQAYLTYDERVLDRDYAFAEWIENDSAGMFVIEDADNLLKSRSEGNNMVARFLNVGDGMVKVPGKKLIFSTNLPKLTDIDQALIRPGRCFDIIKFRPLTKVEALVMTKERNLVMPDRSDDKYTLAELFSGQITESIKGSGKAMGFF